MSLLSVEAESLDLDAVIAALQSAILGTVVETEDFYRERLASEIEIARKHLRPVPNCVTISTERCAAEYGLTRVVQLPLEGVVLRGQFRRSGVFLVTCQTIPDEAFDPVRKALARFPGLQIDVSH